MAASHLMGSPLKIVVVGDFVFSQPVRVSSLGIKPKVNTDTWTVQTAPTQWKDGPALLTFVLGDSAIVSLMFPLSPHTETRNSLINVFSGSLNIQKVTFTALSISSSINYGILSSIADASLSLSKVAVTDTRFSSSPVLVVADQSTLETNSLSFTDLTFLSSVPDPVLLIIQSDEILSQSPDDLTRLVVSNVQPTAIEGLTSESLCGWNSGVVRIVNRKTKFTHSSFSSVSSFGALFLDSSDVTLTNCSFADNTAGHASFPSANRNILCSSTTLTVTDGDWTAPESLWMNDEDCIVKGDWADRDTFLFVPTLSASSSSTFNKIMNTFTVEIKGSTLFPCGLGLEVFDVGEDRSEGSSKRLSLTPDTTTSFSETHISLSIPFSTFNQLDKTLIWKARLVHSDNQHTPVSFSFRTPAEGGKDVVLVSSDGSDDTAECGRAVLPCRTLFVGWLSRIVRGNDENSVTLTIHRKASIGSSVSIDAKSLTVTHSTSPSDQLEVDLPTSDSLGMLSLEGGELMIHDLMIVLGSSHEGISLLDGSADRDELIVDIENCLSVRISVLVVLSLADNPYLFASSDRRDNSSTLPRHRQLCHLSPRHSAMSVALSSCLFIDSSLPRSTQNGAFCVQPNNVVAKVEMKNCWMEEMTSSSLPFERSGGGVAILDMARRRQLGQSNSPLAVVVYRDVQNCQVVSTVHVFPYLLVLFLKF
ncbi:hypothetical protein BLNAU_11028 [Blattamonas nauphoetae]|uniref:Uncharacterized protein n=1 Tax=Blattamonas nauphoetae TaxID=2049346 RepID=A0ABQ9XR48_9EUKA|nr:hypothetical protein BLNAU_11028 [Blattamonas nauphoetae]